MSDDRVGELEEVRRHYIREIAALRAELADKSAEVSRLTAELEKAQSVIDQTPSMRLGDELALIRAELERERAQRKWIKTADRLPDECDVVVGWWTDHTIQMVFLHRGTWTDGANISADWSAPFAWMPLPAPPSAQGGGEGSPTGETP